MLGVAIIGCGNISKAHIEGYMAFSNLCEIKALVDIDPEKAKKKKSDFDFQAQVFDDHKAILGREDIDLISICTPPYTHKEIACNGLLADKHVLLEKPMASSLEECDLILEASKKSKGKLSVVAQNRFKNSIMKLKKTLDSGLIGDLKHVQVDSHWFRGHCYYDLWWRGSWEKEGGGCTLNHAVHHIDMIQWMVGMPTSVTGVLANVAHDNAEVEDLSIAIMTYGRETLAQVTSSVVHHGEEQKVILQGAYGKIMAPWDVKAMKSLANGFPEIDKDLEEEIQTYYDNLKTLEYENHTGQIQNMLEAIDNNVNPLVSGQDGRNALEIIMAIYKAGSLGMSVGLPLSKEDDFYTKEGALKRYTHFYEKKKGVDNLEDLAITFSNL